MIGNCASAQQGAVALSAIEVADFGALSGGARFVLAASSVESFLASYQLSSAGQLQPIEHIGSIDVTIRRSLQLPTSGAAN